MIFCWSIIQDFCCWVIHIDRHVNFSSNTKWNYKIAWIRALIHRAKKLCSENKILTEIKNIRLFAVYNGYPKQIVNSVLKRCRENENKQRDDEIDDSVVPQLYLKLPYQGINGGKIVKKMKRKLRHCLKKDLNVSINVYYSTTKISYYTSTKDHIPKLNKAAVRLQVSGCLRQWVLKYWDWVKYLFVNFDPKGANSVSV